MSQISLKLKNHKKEQVVAFFATTANDVKIKKRVIYLSFLLFFLQDLLGKIRKNPRFVLQG